MMSPPVGSDIRTPGALQHALAILAQDLEAVQREAYRLLDAQSPAPDQAVADQQRLEKRAEEAEARCQELRDRELEAKERVTELEAALRREQQEALDQKAKQKALTRERDDAMDAQAEANASLAERSQDTVLLDALEMAEPFLEVNVGSGTASGPLIEVRVTRELSEWPCSQPATVREALRALVGLPAQEPEPGEDEA